MTLRIHHTVAKQAAKFGLTLEIVAEEVVAMKDGAAVAQAPTASAALAAAITKLGLSTKTVMDKLRKPKSAKSVAKKAKGKKRKAKKSDEDGDEEDDEGEAEGKSVIKKKYKTKYHPHKMTCGDATSKQIRAEFMTIKDPDTKKLKIDWAKFKQFAKNNGCWSEEYSKLNKGMRRMNIVNRLRAKIEAGHEVIWAV